MSTVAVTGAAGPVGRAVLQRLERDEGISRLVAVDTDPPGLPAPIVEYRAADLRDRFLPLALHGVDVVVHCGFSEVIGEPEDTAFARNVGAMRNLLAALAKVGARKLVVVSSAVVYGAHSDNPVPLDESAPLRATPDLPAAHQRMLAEELVWEWSDTADAVVTVLRPVTIVGPGVDTIWTRLLEGPRLVRIRGTRPVAQVVAVDDVAAAVALAVAEDLPGAFNVAADGWLSAREVGAALGKRSVELGETVLYEAARWLAARGLGLAEPGLVHHLAYPCTVRTARLKAHGWVPTVSHRDALRAFADERRDWLALGRFRLDRRVLRRAGLGAAIVAAVVALRVLRRATR